MISGDPFQSFINFLFRPGIEGGFSTDKTDPGNWTGGKVGVGELRGTKYGISAAAYPDCDINGLTQGAAQNLYFRDYWCKAACHLLPPALAFLTADAAVQHGPEQAVKFLQRALGLKDDGSAGPVTVNAARASGDAAVDAALAQRVAFYIKLPNQKTQDVNAGGWAARMIALCREVM